MRHCARTIVRRFSIGVFETPLKRPFVTALGHKTTTRNVGITLTLADGSTGYGEASSSLALAHLKASALARTLGALGRAAVGRDARESRALIDAAWRRYAHISPAVAAFEAALLSALCHAHGLSLADYFGGRLDCIETDITISAWDDQEQIRTAAAEAAREGFRILKIKVGGENYADDLARVRAVRAAAPQARVRLDGNQGLTVKSALRMVEACLKDGPVDLLEQPLPKLDIAAMAQLTKRCPVPVAADESVATAQDAVRVVEARAASVINIKNAKSGFLRSLDIAAVARAAGLKLMIGCMCETAQGLAASVHFALGTGFFDFVDLDSDHLLAETASRRSGWVRRGPQLFLK